MLWHQSNFANGLFSLGENNGKVVLFAFYANIYNKLLNRVGNIV